MRPRFGRVGYVDLLLLLLSLLKNLMLLLLRWLSVRLAGWLFPSMFQIHMQASCFASTAALTACWLALCLRATHVLCNLAYTHQSCVQHTVATVLLLLSTLNARILRMC
jgi:hypothetical protein